MKRNSILFNTDGQDGGSNVAATAVEPMTFDVVEFEDGDYKGFKYNVPSYNVSGSVVSATIDAGTAKAIETYGEGAVLALLNSSILGRIRTKVKNALPKGLTGQALAAEQQKQLTLHPDGVLYSAEDATKWRPDMRELSPNQLFKKAKECFNNAAKESDITKKMALMQQGQALLVEMGKALAS